MRRFSIQFSHLVSHVLLVVAMVLTFVIIATASDHRPIRNCELEGWERNVVFPDPHMTQMVSLWGNGSGEIWAGGFYWGEEAGAGLVKYDGKRWNPIKVDHPSFQFDSYIAGIHSLQNGNKLLLIDRAYGDRDQQEILEYANGTWSTYRSFPRETRLIFHRSFMDGSFFCTRLDPGSTIPCLYDVIDNSIVSCSDFISTENVGSIFDRSQLVAGLGKSNYWTASPSQGLLTHWMNGNPHLVPFPGSTKPYSIWAYQDGTLWIGAEASMHFFDGTHWSTYDLNVSHSSLYDSSVRTIWSIDKNATWAVVGNSEIHFWDGKSWTHQYGTLGPVTWGIYDLWGDSVNNIWAPNGRMLAFGNGASWESYPHPSSGSISWVEVIDRNSIYFLSSRGLFFFNGDRWRVEEDVVGDVRTVLASSRDNVWVTGATGFIMHKDGAGWRQIPFTFNGEDLRSVELATAGPDKTWVRTDDNRCFRWDGTQWHFVPGEILRAYQFGDTGWLVKDHAGQLGFHRVLPDGNLGYVMPSGVGNIRGSSSDNVWIADVDDIYHWNGDNLVHWHFPGYRFTITSTYSQDEVYIADMDGRGIFRFDHTTLMPYSSRDLPSTRACLGPGRHIGFESPGLVEFRTLRKDEAPSQLALAGFGPSGIDAPDGTLTLQAVTIQDAECYRDNDRSQIEVAYQGIPLGIMLSPNGSGYDPLRLYQRDVPISGAGAGNLLLELTYQNTNIPNAFIQRWPYLTVGM